jgi:lipopolysaccharide transport system permease protein
MGLVASSTSAPLVIGPQPKFSLGLGELWRYRELFYFFTWRDIKVKYKQTSLGVAWAVLQPLLLTIVFALFFGARMQREIDFPYPVFAFTGLLLWNAFAGGLTSAGTSMVANSHILQKAYFPRLVIPVSAVLVALFDLSMGLPVLAGLAVWFRCVPRPFLAPFFAGGLLLALAATLGAGCWLAALCVKFRDFRYVLPFLVQLLLFLTPVIYPVSYAQQGWTRWLLALNPMSGPIALFRSMFSALPIDWMLTAASAASAMLLLMLGVGYFRKTEAYFADLG